MIGTSPADKVPIVRKPFWKRSNVLPSQPLGHSSTTYIREQILALHIPKRLKAQQTANGKEAHHSSDRLASRIGDGNTSTALCSSGVQVQTQRGAVHACWQGVASERACSAVEIAAIEGRDGGGGALGDDGCMGKASDCECSECVCEVHLELGIIELAEKNVAALRCFQTQGGDVQLKYFGRLSLMPAQHSATSLHKAKANKFQI